MASISAPIHMSSDSYSNGVEMSPTETNKEPKRKKGLVFQFTKFRNSLESSFSCFQASSSNSRRGYGGRLLCCLKQPEVAENTNGDQEVFSYEYLKSMIERNDFYSKECDTHLD